MTCSITFCIRRIAGRGLADLTGPGGAWRSAARPWLPRGLCGVAAVDVEDRAVDVSGLVAGQAREALFCTFTLISATLSGLFSA